ncbi:hypothetical protein [Anaerocolumna sp.]|uniref:hypothetical protein n=1 Tax=Anaerocolumna sp. TaxID=2041569 RepID=UPI0028B1E450|nr:hypothetical protein [Anaerocolumna sp.]
MKVLDNLYQNFSYEGVRIDTEKWDTEGIIYDLGYLLDKYLLKKNNVKWKNIKSVRFDTIYKENNDIKKTAYKAIGIYFGIVFGLSVNISFYKIQIKIIIFLFCIYAIMAVVAYLVKPIRFGLMSTVYFKCGYFVEYCNKIKYEVGTITPTSDWYMFIHSLECILYFYKIAINKSDQEDVNIEKKIIEYIVSRNQDGNCDLLLSLLLYLKFEKNDNIHTWDGIHRIIVEKICCPIFVNPNSIQYQIANSVICDINRDTNGDKNSNITSNQLELKNEKFFKFCKCIKDIS